MKSYCRCFWFISFYHPNDGSRSVIRNVDGKHTQSKPETTTITIMNCGKLISLRKILLKLQKAILDQRWTRVYKYSFYLLQQKSLVKSRNLLQVYIHLKMTLLVFFSYGLNGILTSQIWKWEGSAQTFAKKGILDHWLYLIIFNICTMTPQHLLSWWPNVPTLIL